jgi:hypothetical protein
MKVELGDRVSFIGNFPNVLWAVFEVNLTDRFRGSLWRALANSLWVSLGVGFRNPLCRPV